MEFKLNNGNRIPTGKTPELEVDPNGRIVKARFTVHPEDLDTGTDVKLNSVDKKAMVNDGFKHPGVDPITGKQTVETAGHMRAD